ncbi:putative mitochondrial carrier protein PET8 [Diplonema papillatum]|nr:putative mitochondrial carrier protein PET8 [Diplonema papillatum]
MGNESVPFEPWNQWWHNAPYLTSLTAGGCAGLTVDVILYPLDCIKTRRQAAGGLAKSGGYRNLYSGLRAAALGSIPCSALFFVTYEWAKDKIKLNDTSNLLPNWSVCASAAAAGELVACSIRVPAELVKQRMQVGRVKSLQDAATAIRKGGFKGLVGYKATIARDIPFSVLQYPMYETAKHWISGGEPLPAWNSALVGACTGSISAFLTTPLDVCKTRIMLGNQNDNSSIFAHLTRIHREEGVSGLYRGCLSRSMWMGLGGLLFLGSYEQCKDVLCGDYNPTSQQQVQEA